MRIETVTTLASLDAREWNAVAGTSNPFVSHEFLSALERTGCVGARAGWEPHFILLRDAAGIAAAAPAWLKNQSYGEFVFDFSWAQAYARHGLAYYPKLVIAAPFTPATGPRLLVRPDLDRASVVPRLIAAVESCADAMGLATTHVLFPPAEDRQALAAAGWLPHYHQRRRTSGHAETL